MLFAGALALLTVVVALIVTLLLLDLRRRADEHWLDAIKSWQQLIGAVLGFLGAAGVLVLSTAIQSDAESRRAQSTSRAIGLGLAYEVETMGVGLNTAQVVGHRNLAEADPGAKCLGYANAIMQAIEPKAPVYEAVLPRLADFGDQNLYAFVSFHTYYNKLLRTVPDIIANDCRDPATNIYFLQYMVGQVDHAMYFYGLISDQYGIAPPTMPRDTVLPGQPSPGTVPEPPSFGPTSSQQ